MRIATVQVYLIIIKNDAFQVAIHEIEELVSNKETDTRVELELNLL